MPNHLAKETSPYLLQHAHNPVNWYPWGDEALSKAREEQKPIFLSIGYTACHWCHVMERESFENPVTAQILNAHFISIKVDREERPDLDSIYMNAVIAMTGSGGWPMSVFLTPDLAPFYGGTYFPPIRRFNLPSFQEILLGVASAWEEDRANVLKSAGQLTAHLQAGSVWPASTANELDAQVLNSAVQSLSASIDSHHGGWGSAPKFPQPMALEFLLQQAVLGDANALQTAEISLTAMQRGGIYDVVGGGFHRYSTTADWLVPHFEKMLYDNAQLARVYLHAWQITAKADYLSTCIRTLDFILREMRHPGGGFFSSLDADSEGEEGKFYTWSLPELRSILSDQQFSLLQATYPLPAGGNFEGKIIMQLPVDLGLLAAEIGTSEQILAQDLDQIHAQLLAYRGRRTRPQTDDKIITAWNGLTLQVFAEAARALNRPDYLAAAQSSAAFLLSELRQDDRLLRTWRNGQARNAAALEDYAALILGLLALYQADFNPLWFRESIKLTENMLANYYDPADGFFDAAADVNHLLIRPKNLQDNATPSGTALAALALLLLSSYEGHTNWHHLAGQALAPMQAALAQHPLAFSFWLQAQHLAVGPLKQVAVVWPSSQPAPESLLAPYWHTYQPLTILAGSPLPLPDHHPQLLHDRPLVNGQAAVYVCQNFTCQMPYTS